MPSEPSALAIVQSADVNPLDDRVFGALVRLPFPCRSVNYETHGHTVVLTGVLPSYYQARCLENAVERVEGVEQIENRILVGTA